MKKIVAVLLLCSLNLCSRTFASGGSKGFCAAVRGNGEYILAHFGALARLTESYGVLDGMAGGSSAAVTAFFYESMKMNPLVLNCGDRACTKKEKARRVALLLKAGPGVIQVLKETPEALALLQLALLQQEVKTKGIEALFEEGKVVEGGQALRILLESKELQSMINPEIIELIVLGRGKEVYDQIANFGKWQITSPEPFFKPGFINFKAAPDVFGRIADFYAGRGPVNKERMEEFFENCAGTDSLGKDWQALGEECRESFYDLFKEFREKYDVAKDFPRRKNEFVGGGLSALIATSVLEGKVGSDLWKRNVREYWRTTNPHFDFEPGFDRIKFGYWGRFEELDRVGKALSKSSDLKSQKFLPLGPARWRDVLDKSPAEPGIASGQEIDEEHISLGGWSDLHPVQILKAMGCRHVVYVTRRGQESPFVISVARQLGMSKKEEDRLYTLKEGGNPSSSYQAALQMAEAILCTDWNKSSIADLNAMTRETYEAPLVSRLSFFRKPLQGAATQILPSLKVEGCDGKTGSLPLFYGGVY